MTVLLLQRRRRATAFLAVPLLGLSVLGVVSTTGSSAATSATTTSSVAAIPACHGSQLVAWQAIPGSGTAGSVYYELEFSNISHRTCTLRGFPRAWAVNSNGHRIGRAAAHEPGFPLVRVTLRPGASAHAVLRVTDVSVYSPRTCRPTTASGLRIVPPGTRTSFFVDEQLRVCASGSITDMTVRPVHAGIGIPGYGT